MLMTLLLNIYRIQKMCCKGCFLSINCCQINFWFFYWYIIPSSLHLLQNYPKFLANLQKNWQSFLNEIELKSLIFSFAHYIINIDLIKLKLVQYSLSSMSINCSNLTVNGLSSTLSLFLQILHVTYLCTDDDS